MNINQLPELAFHKILSYLNRNDKLNCKLVCSYWECQIDSLNYSKKLCIYNGNYPFEKRFLYTNELIGYQNSLNIDQKRPIHLKFLNYFKKIKKLSVINNHKKMSFEVDFSKKLDQLEQLELLNFNLKSINLNSKNLKILSIDKCYFMNPTINCPNLEALVYYPLEKHPFQRFVHQFPNFQHKSSLKLIECNKFILEMQSFKNLETIICKKLESDDNLIENLPKLNQLQIATIDNNNKSIIRNLKLQIIDQKRYDLNFLFLDLEKFQNQRNYLLNYDYEFLFLNGKHLEGKFNELNKSIYVPFSTSLYYNGLIEKFTQNQLNTVLFKKLRNIYKVEVFKTTEENKLINFLNNCDNLKHLELYQTSLTQSFYNKLRFFKSIEYLDIKELINWYIYDYDFLIDLNNLKMILVYYDLAFDLNLIITFIYNAFSKCKNLAKFVFGYENSKIIISKNKNNLFDLDYTFVQQPFKLQNNRNNNLDKIIEDIIYLTPLIIQKNELPRTNPITDL